MHIYEVVYLESQQHHIYSNLIKEILMDQLHYQNQRSNSMQQNYKAPQIDRDGFTTVKIRFKIERGPPLLHFDAKNTYITKK